MRRRATRWLGALAILLGFLLGLRSAWPEAEASLEPAGAEVVAEEPPPLPPLPPAADLPLAVQRYLASTVYPPGSGRLDPERVDLLQPNRRYERPRPIRDTLGPDGDAVVYFELSADRYDLTGGEPTAVWLELQRAGEPLRAGDVSARIWREGRAGREGEPIPLRFRWRGVRHEAELDPRDFAEHHGFVLVEVEFEVDRGAPQRETLRFSHTPESLVPARFTGQLHDYVRDGSLRVEVGLDVEREGFFRLDANLYEAEGAPVAYASWKGELYEGRHHVPLEVFGKVLRDAGASGPYLIGELRGYRFVDGAFPDREQIPGPGPSGLTERYALSEFSDAAWDSEHKRHVVELMLQDEAAGISLDVPDLPPGAGAAPPPGVP